MKKLPATSARLIRDIAANSRNRWFAALETLHGWPALERAGYVQKAGDRAELTAAGLAYCSANGIPALSPSLKPGQPLHLKVGQLWQVGGKLYRINSMNGPDCCYPIEMREVARNPKINQEIDSRAKMYPEGSRANLLATKEPFEMKQEPAWFERSDVSGWLGSIADWRRAIESKP